MLLESKKPVEPEPVGIRSTFVKKTPGLSEKSSDMRLERPVGLLA